MSEARSSEPAVGPVLIGWKEYVDFPDWNIHRVKAKIDTGARSSALDVIDYELRETTEGQLVAQLHLGLDRKRPARLATVEVPVLQMVVVSSSTGMRQQRPLLEVNVRLGTQVKRVRLTVTNRASMCFPMILGRTALAGDFLVDVSQKYLLGRKSPPKRAAEG
jgi:hypothetical protein